MADDPIPTRTYKILLVDDEPDLLENYEYFFSRPPFKSLTANNGAEALQILSLDDIDGIVTDVRMAPVDGLELVTKIRRQMGQEIPIFVVTGFSDHTEDEILAVGADGLFFKPTELRELSERMFSLLQKRHANRSA